MAHRGSMSLRTVECTPSAPMSTSALALVAVGEVGGDTMWVLIDANQLLGVVDSHTGSLRPVPENAVQHDRGR